MDSIGRLNNWENACEECVNKQIALEYYGYSRIEEFEEVDENQSNGNGITGNDETSEDFRDSWEIIELFDLGCMTSSAINYDPNTENDLDPLEYAINLGLPNSRTKYKIRKVLNEIFTNKPALIPKNNLVFQYLSLEAPVIF